MRMILSVGGDRRRIPFVVLVFHRVPSGVASRRGISRIRGRNGMPGTVSDWIGRRCRSWSSRCASVGRLTWCCCKRVRLLSEGYNGGPRRRRTGRVRRGTCATCFVVMDEHSLNPCQDFLLLCELIFGKFQFLTQGSHFFFHDGTCFLF